MPDETKPLGVAADYGELIALFEQRRCELDITLIEIDGRILGPVTLPRVLEALGLGLAVVPTAEPERGRRNTAMVRRSR